MCVLYTSEQPYFCQQIGAYVQAEVLQGII